MYNFIRLQYKMGKITKEQVFGFVPKWITFEQANSIVGEFNVGDKITIQ